MNLDLEFIIESVHAMMEDTNIKLSDLNIKYITGTVGIDNPYVIVKGKQYRVRVETLVLNENNELLVDKKNEITKYGHKYALPGGGLDKGASLIEVAENECREEAKITLKDVKNGGITYTTSYNGKYPGWQKEKLWPVGLRYEGSISFIFVTRYKGKYTGYIEPVHRDNFYKTAKFYPIKDIELRKEHKDAIEQYLKLK